MFKEKIIIEMKEVFKEIPFGIEHTAASSERQAGLCGTGRRSARRERTSPISRPRTPVKRFRWM